MSRLAFPSDLPSAGPGLRRGTSNRVRHRVSTQGTDPLNSLSYEPSFGVSIGLAGEQPHDARFGNHHQVRPAVAIDVTRSG